MTTQCRDNGSITSVPPPPPLPSATTCDELRLSDELGAANATDNKMSPHVKTLKPTAKELILESFEAFCDSTSNMKEKFLLGLNKNLTKTRRLKKAFEIGGVRVGVSVLWHNLLKDTRKIKGIVRKYAVEVDAIVLDPLLRGVFTILRYVLCAVIYTLYPLLYALWKGTGFVYACMARRRRMPAARALSPASFRASAVRLKTSLHSDANDCIDDEGYNSMLSPASDYELANSNGQFSDDAIVALARKDVERAQRRASRNKNQTKDGEPSDRNWWQGSVSGHRNTGESTGERGDGESTVKLGEKLWQPLAPLSEMKPETNMGTKDDGLECPQKHQQQTSSILSRASSSQPSQSAAAIDSEPCQAIGYEEELLRDASEPSRRICQAHFGLTSRTKITVVVAQTMSKQQKEWHRRLSLRSAFHFTAVVYSLFLIKLRWHWTGAKSFWTRKQTPFFIRETLLREERLLDEDRHQLCSCYVHFKERSAMAKERECDEKQERVFAKRESRRLANKRDERVAEEGVKESHAETSTSDGVFQVVYTTHAMAPSRVQSSSPTFSSSSSSSGESAPLSILQSDNYITAANASTLSTRSAGGVKVTPKKKRRPSALISRITRKLRRSIKSKNKKASSSSSSPLSVAKGPNELQQSKRKNDAILRESHNPPVVDKITTTTSMKSPEPTDLVVAALTQKHPLNESIASSSAHGPSSASASVSPSGERRHSVTTSANHSVTFTFGSHPPVCSLVGIGGNTNSSDGNGAPALERTDVNARTNHFGSTNLRTDTSQMVTNLIPIVAANAPHSGLNSNLYSSSSRPLFALVNSNKGVESKSADGLLRDGNSTSITGGTTSPLLWSSSATMVVESNSRSLDLKEMKKLLKNEAKKKEGRLQASKEKEKETKKLVRQAKKIALKAEEAFEKRNRQTEKEMREAIKNGNFRFTENGDICL